MKIEWLALIETGLVSTACDLVSRQNFRS